MTIDDVCNDKKKKEESITEIIIPIGLRTKMTGEWGGRRTTSKDAVKKYVKEQKKRNREYNQQVNYDEEEI